jgi:hypothetical protein
VSEDNYIICNLRPETNPFEVVCIFERMSVLDAIDVFFIVVSLFLSGVNYVTISVFFKLRPTQKGAFFEHRYLHL